MRKVALFVVVMLLFVPVSISESVSFQNGDTGVGVQAIQKSLVALSYLSEEYISGNYDEMTELAILAFQIDHSITPTGVADADTQHAIADVLRSMLGGSSSEDQEMGELGQQDIVVTEETNIDSDILGEDFSDYAAEVNIDSLSELKMGDSGINVVIMQDRLRDLCFMKYTDFSGYGQDTFDAVCDFQQSAGLKVTGIADVDTLKVLYAKGAPKNYMTVDDYKSIMRDPNATFDNPYVITGSVMKIYEESKGDNTDVIMLVVIDDNNDDIVLVHYTRYEYGTRVLQGDSVIVYGEVHGTRQYTTVLGIKKEVPLIDASDRVYIR